MIFNMLVSLYFVFEINILEWTSFPFIGSCHRVSCVVQFWKCVWVWCSFLLKCNVVWVKSVKAVIFSIRKKVKLWGRQVFIQVLTPLEFYLVMKILFFLFLVDLQIELCFYFSRYSFLCYTIFVFFLFLLFFCFVFVFLFLVLLLLCLWTCSVFLDIQVMLFLIECLLWSFQGILLLAWWSGFGLVVNTTGGVEIFFMISSTWSVAVTLVVCYRFYTSFSYIVYFVEFTLNKNGVNTGFFRSVSIREHCFYLFGERRTRELVLFFTFCLCFKI